MWIPDSDSRKYIQYGGLFPESLYRYRTVTPENIDRLITFELIEEGIYLAGLSELNDPDEGRFQMSFGNDYDQVFQYWREAIASTDPNASTSEVERIAKLYADELRDSNYCIPDHVVRHTRGILEKLVRVACFTTLPTNYAMWANYGKYVSTAGESIGHGGICIEYLCDEGWRHTTLHPVEYNDAIPTIYLVKRIEEELAKSMYSKSPEWRGESEWRLTSIINSSLPLPANFAANSKIQMRGAVQSVIFGISTPEELVQTFLTRLSSAKPTLKFKRVVQDIVTFERRLIELDSTNVTA